MCKTNILSDFTVSDDTLFRRECLHLTMFYGERFMKNFYVFLEEKGYSKEQIESFSNYQLGIFYEEFKKIQTQLKK